MRKILLASIFLLTIFSGCVINVSAQSYVSGTIDALNNSIGLNPAFSGNGAVGKIVSTLVPYLMMIAGFVLIFMLITGGIMMMTAGDSPDKADAGKSRVTSSILGFIVMFSAYWIAQIVQIMLGVRIL